MAHNFVKGTCKQMCPEREIQMREKESLLHKLEMLAGTENTKRPKADRNRVVKSFGRPAAGRNVETSDNLRPPEVLRMTVNYLLHDVLTVEYLRWNIIYDFIMDRLRAVRQDMIIQNLSAFDSISILEPVIRFYAYASYRLCEEELSLYDPYMNKSHLQECLKRVLVLYDEYDLLHERTLRYNVNLSKKKEITLISFYNHLLETRPEMESLYLILNLGDLDAINRALNLSSKWRVTIVNDCLKISVSYLKNNWVRMCQLIYKLPSLLAAAASLHLPDIRRKALLTMSVAYSSKNLSFPAEVVQKWLLYSSPEKFILDCHYYNIFLIDKYRVQFLKNNFDMKKKVVSAHHELFVDEKLKHCLIPPLLIKSTS